MPQDSKHVDANAIHHLFWRPEMRDDVEDLFYKLEEQSKTSATYGVHAHFGLTLSEMFPHVLAVDTASELSLIYKNNPYRPVVQSNRTL